MNRATCKICNLEKFKVAVKVYSSGTIHWTDENGNGWHGSTCPDCRSEYKRQKYSKNKLNEKQCAKCNKIYQPKRHNQKLCSDCKAKS